MIEWDETPVGGMSLARVPDGDRWRTNGDPTPGWANRTGSALPVPAIWLPTPSAPKEEDERNRPRFG
jgi:hypothetical protein